MKKILAVIASPRKGETLKAVIKFESEIKRLEDAEIEYVMLSELKLADCTGCHQCFLKGQEYCRESQKIKTLQEKMLAADAVILATPVYNQHVTALMKKFLDYFTFMWHRPAMFGVKFFGISSGGGMFGNVFRFLKTNVTCWGGTWAGELGVPHYESLTPKYKKKCDESFSKKARELMAAIDDKRLPKPTISRLMYFNLWKLNAITGKDYNPADYAWWTEKHLFDSQYYYQTRIGMFKRSLIKVLSGLMRSFMRRVYVGY